LGDQIKEDETGRASGTYGEMRNIYRAFGGDNIKEKGYLEDPDDMQLDVNTFTAIVDLSRSNFSIALFQLKSGGKLVQHLQYI